MSVAAMIRAAALALLALVSVASAPRANMLLTGAGSAPPVGPIVHATPSNAFTDNTTTLTFTIPATTAGNFLVVGVFFCGNAGCSSNGNIATTTTAVMGGATGSYIVGTEAFSAGAGYSQAFFEFDNIASGQTSITITYPHGVYYSSGTAAEISGAATTSVTEQGANFGTSSTPPNPETCTLAGNASQTNETIIGMASFPSAVNPPFTFIAGSIGMAYHVLATASTDTVSFPNAAAGGDPTIGLCSIFAIKHP